MPSPETAAAARQLFDVEDLPWPPVPSDMAQRLQAQAISNVFASRVLAVSPYEIEHYVREVVVGPQPADYALVGFAGHGVNSWAAHFFLVQETSAFFLQVPWAGAYTDADASRAELERWFGAVARLVPQIDACGKVRCISPGERLVVVASQFIPSGWTWLPAPVKSPREVAWTTGPGMLAAIEASLASRLANRPSP